MAAKAHREINDVEQTKKMVPFIMRETCFGWQVRKLVFGVDIFGVDLGVQMNSVKQPIKSNSVSSGHVSHHWTSIF